MQTNFSFNLRHVDPIDLEILNEPIMAEIVSSDYGRIIVSVSDSDIGAGSLIVIDLKDIIELGRCPEYVEDSQLCRLWFPEAFTKNGDIKKTRIETGEHGTLYIMVNTTEGVETYTLYDFKLVHY